MAREAQDPYSQNLLINSFRFGYQTHFTPETPTTMNLVQAHIEAGEKLPFVALTDHQTMGQGRGNGRVWMDIPGRAILMSVGLKITEESTPYFADLVALQVAEALNTKTGAGVDIKYPNDLVIEGAKVGGMLIRNVYDGSQYKGTNVGIGINIHYNASEVEGYSLEYPATSLGLHTLTTPKREGLVEAVLWKLKFTPTDAHVFTSNRSQQEVWNQKWRVASYLIGKDVKIESAGAEVVTGRVLDTQIGKGLLIGKTWYDRFDENMKVRVVN